MACRMIITESRLPRPFTNLQVMCCCQFDIAHFLTVLREWLAVIPCVAAQPHPDPMRLLSNLPA